MTDERERPTVNQPLHGPRRTYGKPVLMVIGILAIVAGIIALTLYLRYQT